MGKWLKKHLTNIILVMIGLVGVGLIAYPSFSDWWNSFHQTRAIMSYMEDVSNIDPAEYQAIFDNAYAYNRARARAGNQWELSEEEEAVYNEVLNFEGSGIMGYITIDKIDVMLPIYHGTNESVLQVAIGHLAGTSLPVGGESSHSVLTGHRGLPSAKLFTNLDRLVEGDLFIINILNESFTYEVDQIRVVEPSDLSNLAIEEGKDYCTLITCTPYGINTHRLLVRGHRVENVHGEAKVVADAIQIDTKYVAPFVAVPMVLIMLIGSLIRTRRRIRRERKQEAQENEPDHTQETAADGDGDAQGREE